MSGPMEAVLRRTASNPGAARLAQRAQQKADKLKRSKITAVSESLLFKQLRKFNFKARVRLTPSSRTLKKMQPLVAPVAGFVAALTEISLLFPTEYCKVQLQLNKGNASFSLPNHLRERGLKIYQGLPPMLIGAPLQGLLRFSCLDIVSNSSVLKSSPVFSSPAVSGLIAGICAGVVESVLVVTPMETIKTKLIDSKRGLVEGTSHILRTQGIAGLYNGLMPTILKSTSNQAIRFIVFSQYKEIMLERSTSADGVVPTKLTILQSLGGGVLAGLVGCLLNTPIDTVKSRMQSLERSKYKNSIDCAHQMVKNEGVGSLYKGLFMRSARVVPGQGIIFVVYEQVSSRLHSRLDHALVSLA